MQVLRQNPAIQGFLLPAIAPHRVFGWDSQPERCTRPRAQAYWERTEAKNKAAEEARAAAEAATAFNRRINRLLGDSGMGARFQNRTFDRFQVTPENQKAYTACKEYAAAFKAQMLPGKGEDGEAVPAAGAQRPFLGGEAMAPAKHTWPQPLQMS